MNVNFIEASSLAIIDRKLEGLEENIAPAQYEIIRQVIYATADWEYGSLIKFSPDALGKGAAALSTVMPIIVDVPEIQVNIVPQLQQTFANPVYCCATSSQEPTEKSSRATVGLEMFASQYPHGIFIVGQDQSALSTLAKLLKDKAIEPSFVIATPPVFIESDGKQRLEQSSVPYIYTKESKGGANVASAIFNGLVRLTWQAHQRNKQ